MGRLTTFSMFPHTTRQLQGSTTLATPRKKNRPFNEQVTKAAKVQEQVGWGALANIISGCWANYKVKNKIYNKFWCLRLGFDVRGHYLEGIGAEVYLDIHGPSEQAGNHCLYPHLY